MYNDTLTRKIWASGYGLFNAMAIWFDQVLKISSVIAVLMIWS